MNSNFRSMFKRIAIYDFYISMIFITIIYFTARSYVLFFLLGIIIELMNLYVNGITVEYSLDSKNVKGKGIMIVLGTLMRILLVSVIGFAISRHNMFNIIAYIFGYSAQFISLIYYGINNNKDIEGK